MVVLVGIACDLPVPCIILSYHTTHQLTTVGCQAFAVMVPGSTLLFTVVCLCAISSKLQVLDSLFSYSVASISCSADCAQRLSTQSQTAHAWQVFVKCFKKNHNYRSDHQCDPNI